MQGRKKETVCQRWLNERKEKRNSLSEMAECQKEGRKKETEMAEKKKHCQKCQKETLSLVSEMAEWKEGKKKQRWLNGSKEGKKKQSVRDG